MNKKIPALTYKTESLELPGLAPYPERWTTWQPALPGSPNLSATRMPPRQRCLTTSNPLINQYKNNHDMHFQLSTPKKNSLELEINHLSLLQNWSNVEISWGCHHNVGSQNVDSQTFDRQHFLFCWHIKIYIFKRLSTFWLIKVKILTWKSALWLLK